ncbi:MAG: hypothetical protein SFW64_05645 [Alphaproteobacteria bacterium]|nr:hypothetical protein [Alphaproteobacteria bacterium]
MQKAKPDAPEKPKRDFISLGEKVHNEVTYRGVDWLMNSAFGVLFAFATERTELGRKLWSRPLNKFFTRTFEPVVKFFGASPKVLTNSVGYGITFLSIMFGGTVTIPPLMALENPKNKVPFIKKIDHWFYGKREVENNPKFEKAYQEIEEEPKKDFGTGFKARFVALFPLLAFTLYEPSHLFVKKHFYDYLARGSKFIGEKMGMGAKKYWSEKSIGIPETAAALAAGKEIQTNSARLHDVIAFDFGLTIIYSFLHEITYKLFAQKKEDRHTHAAANHDAQQAPSSHDTAKSATPQAELAEGEEKTPRTHVGNVIHQDRIGAASQFAQGMA